MSNLRITAYLKTHCGWSKGVRALLAKYELPYEERDIIVNPEFRDEMERLSGQPLSPCVIVNDVLLADVSGAELEQYLLEERLVEPTDRPVTAPIDSCCGGRGGSHANHVHASV